LRRQLRAFADVELWHIEEPKTHGQRVPNIRYLVTRGGSEVTFNRPHEAWRYFQQLTGMPDKKVRPEPPPINEAFPAGPRTGKSKRSRRRPKQSPG
jgi:hypothetical protein